jgi:hypothetical protein
MLLLLVAATLTPSREDVVAALFIFAIQPNNDLRNDFQNFGLFTQF